MKILPIVNNIKGDIATSGMHLRKIAGSGYDIADRTAKIYKQGSLKKYINVARSISDKLVKNATINEMPYLAAALGMFIPIPLMSPILFGLGLIIRFSLAPDFDKEKTDNFNKKEKLNKLV